MDALKCTGLSKRYGQTVAVGGLDLTVEEGEVVGFLGRNGAGKTTTLRMLLGLVRPDAGEAWLLGARVPCPQRLAEVGAMVEEPAFYPWLTGEANLRVLADTAGQTSAAGRAAVARTLDRVGLAEVGGRKVKTYSQGMRQRLGLAAALLREPRLLLLDEPANGLDPPGIHEFRELLRALAADGVSILLSSHLLGEVERTCDRVVVIDRGRLIAAGDPNRIAPVRLGITVPAADRDRTVELLSRGGVPVEVGPRERADLEEWFLTLTALRSSSEEAPGASAAS